MRKVSPRWWIIFLLFSGTFINAIDRASLSTAEPVLMKSLHLDEWQMGIILSSFFWFYMLMNIPAGRLADKFGAKRALGWAAFLWSLCSAFTGVAGNFWQLIFARAGVGVGESASFPVNAKVVNNIFEPRERGKVTGLYSCGLRLGFAATPALMVWLMRKTDWRFAFYATGLGSLAWVLLWYFTYTPRPEDDDSIPSPRSDSAGRGAVLKSTSSPLPSPPFHGREGGDAEATSPGSPVRRRSRVALIFGRSGSSALPSKIPWLELLRNRTVLGLVLCKFFQDYLFYLFVTWLPGYLVSNRGFSLIQMGWYASLPWIAATVAQPLAGWISDGLIHRGVSTTASRKGVIIVSQLLAASVIVAGYAGDAMTAVWLLTLSVAAESAASAILWTTCSDVAPRGAAGSLAGIKNTAGALAGILAPTVTGFIAKFTGSFQLAMALGGVMVICAAVSIWFVVGEIKPIELSDALRETCVVTDAH